MRIAKGTNVLIVGLGKSGLSAIRFLQKIEAHVMVSEAKPVDQIDATTLSVLNESGVDYETGRHSDSFFQQAEVILASPGVPLDIEPFQQARARGIAIIGELALAETYLRTPVVAVTGTNGKSTVTAMIGKLLEKAGKKVFVGGNIGTPLTDYLITDQQEDVVVLEVSSFQLDSAGNFRPDIAVLLNITPDHLDRYPAYEDYVTSKFRIFTQQRQQDVAILNKGDEEILKHVALWGRGKKYFFGDEIGSDAGAFFKQGKAWFQRVDNAAVETYNLEGTAFAEEPNRSNALVGILVARLLECQPETIERGLKMFEPLPHRMSLVGDVTGIKFYDDSKATNIGAVKAALLAMDRPVVLIAGGRDKGGDYSYLNDAVRLKVKAMVLIGEAAEKLAAAFGKMTKTVKAKTMEKAVLKAYCLAGKGEAVLLSPACSSFDMFDSYAHRGEVFTEAVKMLEQESGILGIRPMSEAECTCILSCD